MTRHLDADGGFWFTSAANISCWGSVTNHFWSERLSHSSLFNHTGCPSSNCWNGGCMYNNLKTHVQAFTFSLLTHPDPALTSSPFKTSAPFSSRAWLDFCNICFSRLDSSSLAAWSSSALAAFFREMMEACWVMFINHHCSTRQVETFQVGQHNGQSGNNQGMRCQHTIQTWNWILGLEQSLLYLHVAALGLQTHNDIERRRKTDPPLPVKGLCCLAT